MSCHFVRDVANSALLATNLSDQLLECGIIFEDCWSIVCIQVRFNQLVYLGGYLNYLLSFDE